MRLISVWTCMGIAALLTALLSGLSFYQCGLEQPGRECFSAPLTDATTLEPVAEFNTLPNKPRLFRIRKTTASQKAIPVLFVHGHAGSHEQLRWLAEASIEREDNRTTHLEWFSLEMNEQFSALDAHLILQQAHSVNEALTFILHQQLSNASQSAIIIAHSMGGVVARTAFTLPNHPPGSVQTLITLATPHAIPPISIERDMVSLYETVNQFWRTADHWETSPFKNLAIVSIVGGTRDLQIQSQYSELTAIVPDSRGFTVYSSGIPGVWMDLTHESILWCQTCVEAIVHAVSESVAFLSVEERLFSFQRAFSLDARWDVNQLNQVRTQKKTKGRVWTNGVILNLKDLSHSLEPIQLNVPEHGNWTLRVLAVGVENELLGCMPSQMPPCALLNSQFVEIPQAEKSALFMDIVNVQHRYQEIVVHIHRVLDSSTSLLNLELVDSEKELVQQSVGENVGKKRASAPISSLSTLIVFPGIYESFFHYHVTSKLSCPPGEKHPFVLERLKKNSSRTLRLRDSRSKAMRKTASLSA
ncbi:PGAP1-like protein-domain-containing protein [Chytriomyces cf. hyalinus JEL632]|nr:PGAP1-like protein-domain-containing protein [Chytriomyces cf. hyalinus JEL632]